MERHDQNDVAEKWNRLYTDGAKYLPLNEILLSKILAQASEMIGRAPKTALDLGCGAGESIKKMSAAGLKVAGVDCSSIGLKKASVIAADDELILGDLEHVEVLKLGEFDFILCKLTIAFIKDRGVFFTSVKKMMRGDSVFCIMTPVLRERTKYDKGDKPGVAVKYNEFKEVLEKHFGTVIDFHHDYLGEKSDLTTFLVQK